jgi:hypothetical protein
MAGKPIFLYDFQLAVRGVQKKALRAKTIFLNHFNLISPVQPSAQKYLSSVFQKTMFLSLHPESIRGAARDRHGRRIWDAVDVRGVQRALARRRKRPSRTSEGVWS